MMGGPLPLGDRRAIIVGVEGLRTGGRGVVLSDLFSEDSRCTQRTLSGKGVQSLVPVPLGTRAPSSGSLDRARVAHHRSSFTAAGSLFRPLEDDSARSDTRVDERQVGTCNLRGGLAARLSDALDELVHALHVRFGQVSA
jgi:hypothetical protein